MGILQNIHDSIGKKYGVDAVFALTKAEDIWRGIEKCLYGNGNVLHFSKYGDLPCIRAKQMNRGIPISVTDNKLHFKLGRMVFGIQTNDRFQQDEVDAVLSYLAESEILDDRAVNTLIKEGYCIDTYRPCYATLVPRMIRGKSEYICILLSRVKQSQNMIDLAVQDINMAKV